MTFELLERMEVVAQDTRKVFVYDKNSGLWGWRNKYDAELTQSNFKTRVDALIDAVQPYFDESE
jgi:hypothetical protein